jgi:hypothetical protein
LRKISLAAYARNHDVSPQAASKWKARGLLLFENGKVVVEQSDQNLKAAGLGRYADNRPVPKSRPAHNPQAAEVDLLQGIEKLKGVADEVGGAGALTRFLDDIARGRTATLADAATIKENALALKHTLTALRLQGKLIDAAAAENAVFEEFRSMRDSWLSFPSRVSHLLAAETGADPDKLLAALAEHVHQQLSDLGEPEIDFQNAGDGMPDQSSPAREPEKADEDGR